MKKLEKQSIHETKSVKNIYIAWFQKCLPWLINNIGRMVKFSKKRCSCFLPILLYWWTIFSDLARFEHILFFQKDDATNIP